MKRKSSLRLIPLLILISLLALPVVSWGEYVHEKRIYLKAGIGVGGVEDIPLRMFLETGEEVKVERGRGLHFNLEIGYHITPEMSIETGLGWHRNSVASGIIGGDGYFKRVALSATGIYRFLKKEGWNVYGGVGIGYYIAPELYRELLGRRATLHYEDAFGPHLTIGSEIIGREWFLFIDLKHAFGIKYKFKEGVEDGVRFTPRQLAIPEFREINGSGLLLNLGIGYRF